MFDAVDLGVADDRQRARRDVNPTMSSGSLHAEATCVGILPLRLVALPTKPERVYTPSALS
jgi:hypothetical protein